MLKRLKIKNFILIDNAEIEFVSGLNIVTGETGAGKSIFIEALKMVLGERVTADTIGKKSTDACVEAVFEEIVNPFLQQILEEQAIDLEEGRLIIVRKISSIAKKNLVIANGTQITLNTLKKFSEFLFDLHGQHANQNLLRPRTYFQIIDGYDEEINDFLKAYLESFNDWQKCKKENLELKKRSMDREQREEFLRWQIEEIKKVSPQIGEDDALEREIKLLSNAEKIAKGLSFSYEELKESKKGNECIADKLQKVKSELSLVSDIVPEVLNYVKILEEAYYNLLETADSIKEMSREIDFDTTKINQLNARLFLIEQLKRKYGFTLDSVLKYLVQAETELAEIENFEELLLSKQKEEEAIFEKVAKLAKKLSDLRSKAALELAKKVTSELSGLGMLNAKFVVQVQESADYNLHGKDQVAFLFSANSGEEVKSLQKIASGGELSRVALALKCVNLVENALTTVVFDEIDSGIGGKTGKLVAEKIKLLSKKVQVLCITHLPQIACCAERHLLVEKEELQNNTCTKIKVLDKKAQIEEISRMTGLGDIKKSTGIARELIELNNKE